MKIYITLLLLFYPATGFTQIYKCENLDGDTFYQASSCEENSKGKELNIKQNNTDDQEQTKISCKYNIVGTWYVKFVSPELETGMVKAKYEKWIFKADHHVIQSTTKNRVEVPYACSNDTITIKSRYTKRIKIISFEHEKMILKFPTYRSENYLYLQK